MLALRAIREALVLPYAALHVDGVPVAASGTEVAHTRRLTLALGERREGELVVGLRPGDLRPSAGDDHVLRLVAPLLGQTLRASSLAADLQRSRERTVSALEDERRRLRRDLHDDLGPRLSGIAFTSDAARNSLRSDPDSAEALLLSLRAEAVTAIEEIRRLVYGMRPPALDELGLIPALRQQAAALRTAQGSPLRVTITVDALPAGVTAAVEVAAYRIVMEALAIVARHSGGDTAAVRLQVHDDSLVVTVTDAGTTDRPQVARGRRGIRTHGPSPPEQQGSSVIGRRRLDDWIRRSPSAGQCWAPGSRCRAARQCRVAGQTRDR